MQSSDLACDNADRFGIVEIYGRVSVMPRVRLRSLLILITIAAVILTALVRPSTYWAVSLPVIVLVLCVYGVCRAILLPTKRAFWLSFLAGLFAYGVTVIGVRSFFSYYNQAQWDPTNSFIEATAWRLLHGEVPWSFQFTNVYMPHDYVSFVLWLHFAFAISLSAVVAYVVQLLTKVPD
jgi:hypothetical protein